MKWKENMNRLKTFGKYILLLAAFYIVSNILIYFCIQTSYSPVESKIEENSQIEISVSEAKATLINGKIEGSIKNKSAGDLTKKYIKCEFFSKRGTLILTKYIEIDELKIGEEKKIEIGFRAENIKSVKMQITDEVANEENVKIIEGLNQTSDEDKFAAFVAIFILMKCFI